MGKYTYAGILWEILWSHHGYLHIDTVEKAAELWLGPLANPWCWTMRMFFERSMSNNPKKSNKTYELSETAWEISNKPNHHLGSRFRWFYHRTWAIEVNVTFGRESSSSGVAVSTPKRWRIGLGVMINQYMRDAPSMLSRWYKCTQISLSEELFGSLLAWIIFEFGSILCQVGKQMLLGMK